MLTKPIQGNITMKKLLATLAMATVSTAAMAANQGLVGTSSNGDLDITLTIAEEIQVLNLADIDLLDGTAAQTSPACVRGNIASAYDIRFTATEGSFILNHATTADTIGYAVTYSHGGGAAAPATYNTAIVDAGAVYTADADCNSGAANNGVIEVTATAGDVTGATAGTYTGTLAVEVAASL